eukprot:EG_transcript_3567
MAASPNAFSLCDGAPRHRSCVSDCGSSEGSSTPSVAGSPTTAWTQDVAGQATAPRRPAAHRRPKPSWLAGRTAPAPPACWGSGALPPRPLCLDFLKGKCGRERTYCRYYHPQPGEVSLAASPAPSPSQAAVEGTVHDPARPICEVWTLTGFCKYGPRCWKQHPRLAVQLAAPVAEPKTLKFQNWLQGLQMDGAPPSSRPLISSPTSSAASDEALFDTLQSPPSRGRDSSERLVLALQRMRIHFDTTTIAAMAKWAPADAVQPLAPVADSPAAAAGPQSALAGGRPFAHQPYAP